MYLNPSTSCAIQPIPVLIHRQHALRQSVVLSNGSFALDKLGIEIAHLSGSSRNSNSIQGRRLPYHWNTFLIIFRVKEKIVHNLKGLSNLFANILPHKVYSRTRNSTAPGCKRAYLLIHALIPQGFL